MKLERCFVAPGVQPNGLAYYRGSLWILDQTQPPCNLFQVRPPGGAVLYHVTMEAHHAGGLIIGPASSGHDQSIWVSSSGDHEVLEVHPASGSTLSRFPCNAHDLEWRDGEIWAAASDEGAVVRYNPENGEELGRIPAPGHRIHGLGWRDGLLWCAETNHRKIYALDPETGDIRNTIEVGDKAELHGLTVVEGELWFPDAGTGLIWRIVEND